MAMNKDKIELPDLTRLRSQTMGLQRFLKSEGQVKLRLTNTGEAMTTRSTQELGRVCWPWKMSQEIWKYWFYNETSGYRAFSSLPSVSGLQRKFLSVK